MKSKHVVPAVTSLPQAPQVEADHRARRYALTMLIRVACFLLMVLVQPYGWYTWAFALGAAVLPYIAVVFANAGSDSTETAAESPQQQIESKNETAAAPVTDDAQVITIHEQPQDRS